MKGAVLPGLPPGRPLRSTVARRRGRGARELLLLTLCYGCYAVARVLVDDDWSRALASADAILTLERSVGIDVERDLNRLTVGTEALGVAMSWWYATTHFVVTVVVLVWAWRRGPAQYVPARRILLGATFAALACYVLVPTAPPRFVPGYDDVLAQTSGYGYWSDSASAPEGFGDLTNQLAAMPSMHAGWAFWVALVVARLSSRRIVGAAGWGYAATTALVIVATGMHWVLDAVAGWALVAAVAYVVRRHTSGPTPWRMSVRRGPSAARPGRSAGARGLRTGGLAWLERPGVDDELLAAFARGWARGLGAGLDSPDQAEPQIPPRRDHPPAGRDSMTRDSRAHAVNPGAVPDRHRSDVDAGEPTPDDVAVDHRSCRHGAAVKISLRAAWSGTARGIVLSPLTGRSLPSSPAAARATECTERART